MCVRYSTYKVWEWSYNVPPGVADLSSSKELDISVLIVLQALKSDLQVFKRKRLPTLSLEIVCVCVCVWRVAGHTPQAAYTQQRKSITTTQGCRKYRFTYLDQVILQCVGWDVFMWTKQSLSAIPGYAPAPDPLVWRRITRLLCLYSMCYNFPKDGFLKTTIHSPILRTDSLSIRATDILTLGTLSRASWRRMGRHSLANNSQDIRPSNKNISHCFTYLQSEREREREGVVLGYRVSLHHGQIKHWKSLCSVAHIS